MQSPGAALHPHAGTITRCGGIAQLVEHTTEKLGLFSLSLRGSKYRVAANASFLGVRPGPIEPPKVAEFVAVTHS
jgi:hypothetical protein